MTSTGRIAEREAAGRATLAHAASVASVVVASVLIFAKAYAWAISDSTAILSSLVDSLMDVCASIVNLLAVRHALTPADEEHRFGHGKAEALAGLAQSAFIAGSAAFLLIEAAGRLIEPRPIEQGRLGIAIMLLSIALTFGLVMFQRFAIRKSGSLAVSADSLHYVGDLLTNLAVIAALLLASEWGWGLADPIFAIGIAFYIVWSAWSIFRESYDHLMDRELPDEVRAEIRRVVLSHGDVRSLHDLRTRASGAMTFIQLHLEMDPSITLLEAHRIADEVENLVMTAFPGAEVIVHQDPAGIEEPRPDFARR